MIHLNAFNLFLLYHGTPLGDFVILIIELQSVPD